MLLIAIIQKIISKIHVTNQEIHDYIYDDKDDS